jgi:hypothetical protein
MTYKPDAKNGLALLTSYNDVIKDALVDQADMAMARLEVERTESYEAIKIRHRNELKSAKRNFKHRYKKITNLMADFDKMEPMVLADLFKGGVPDNAVSAKLETRWVTMDWSNIENRVLTGRQHGKSEAIDLVMMSRIQKKEEDFAKMYGMSPVSLAS